MLVLDEVVVDAALEEDTELVEFCGAAALLVVGVDTDGKECCGNFSPENLLLLRELLSSGEMPTGCRNFVRPSLTVEGTPQELSKWRR